MPSGDALLLARHYSSGAVACLFFVVFFPELRLHASVPPFRGAAPRSPRTQPRSRGGSAATRGAGNRGGGAGEDRGGAAPARGGRGAPRSCAGPGEVCGGAGGSRVAPGPAALPGAAMAFRRRAKSHPLFSQEFLIHNHADIGFCLVLSVLIALMFEVRTTTPPPPPTLPSILPFPSPRVSDPFVPCLVGSAHRGQPRHHPPARDPPSFPPRCDPLSAGPLCAPQCGRGVPMAPLEQL